MTAGVLETDLSPLASVDDGAGVELTGTFAFRVCCDDDCMVTAAVSPDVIDDDDSMAVAGHVGICGGMACVYGK
jgi:hypothetical protein